MPVSEDIEEVSDDEPAEDLDSEDPLTNSIPPAVVLGAGDADAEPAAVEPESDSGAAEPAVEPEAAVPGAPEITDKAEQE
jgi:hypothetical protein